MEVQWPPARDPDAHRAWQQVLRPIAAELRDSGAQLAERALDRMRAELPELFPDAQTIQDQLASTEASLRQLAGIIDVGGDPRAVDLPASTVAIGRLQVRRQVPLADLMRVYRLAQELIWQWLFDRIIASGLDAAQQATALQLATGWLFGYIDGALVRAEQVYEQEREVWLRSAAAARAEAIDDIVAERERDAQRASKRLRYEVNRHHFGVMAWVDAISEEGDAQPLLGEAISRTARAMKAETSMVQPVGSLVAAGWLSRHGPFGAAPPAITETAGKTPPLPPGVGVAVGEPGHGLSGFRSTHIEASHARRVATLMGARAQRFTRYRDVAVAALASVDHEQAQAFVTRVLGPLGADDEACYRVAMTLSVYLQENRSPARAAQRLTVHPNTVTYRVNQAETILGRSIDTDTVDLAVALALLPMMPAFTPAKPPKL